MAKDKKQDDKQDGTPDISKRAGDDDVPETEEERKKDLQNTFENIEQQQREVNMKQQFQEGKLEQAKEDLFKSFFDMFSKFNVDLSDPSSIGKFLERLESSDPEFFDMLVVVFDSIQSMPPENRPNPQEGGLGVAMKQEAEKNGTKAPDGGLPDLSMDSMKGSKPTQGKGSNDKPPKSPKMPDLGM